jgi:hypothetical protein
MNNNLLNQSIAANTSNFEDHNEYKDNYFSNLSTQFRYTTSNSAPNTPNYDYSNIAETTQRQINDLSTALNHLSLENLQLSRRVSAFVEQSAINNEVLVNCSKQNFAISILCCVFSVMLAASLHNHKNK